MKLPSRMLDLSVPLDNETVLDPPIMRPKIDYQTNKENAWMLLESFPGLHAEDVPDGGWAFELVQFTTTTAPTWTRRIISSRSHSRRADDDHRPGSARLVFPPGPEARFPRAARRPRRQHGRG